MLAKSKKKQKKLVIFSSKIEFDTFLTIKRSNYPFLHFFLQVGVVLVHIP